MMENRSFDHYLGWLPERRRPPGGPHLHRRGRASRTRPHRLTPDWQGCGFPDPDHSWNGGRDAAQRRQVRRLPARLGDNDEFAIGYYAEGDLGVHPGRREGVHDLRPLPLLADGLDAAQPRVHARGAVLRATTTTTSRRRPSTTTGFPDTTIFAALEQARASRTATSSSTCRSSALWGAAGPRALGPVAEYYARCAAGHAAAASRSSTRTSPARSARGRARRATSTRTATCARARRSWPTSCHAFMESPQWKRGALFIVYDEWGGFFDHVAPAARARRPQRRATSTRTTG